MRKLVSLAAIAAGVVGMAMPASAAAPAKTMNAKFAGGGATLTMHPSSTWSRVSVQGLELGKYIYFVGAYVDSNHDGIPEGGQTVEMCRFTVSKGQTRASVCQHSGPALVTGFAPDLFTAEIDKIIPHSGETVRLANFS